MARDVAPPTVVRVACEVKPVVWVSIAVPISIIATLGGAGVHKGILVVAVEAIKEAVFTRNAVSVPVVVNTVAANAAVGRYTLINGFAVDKEVQTLRIRRAGFRAS